MVRARARTLCGGPGPVADWRRHICACPRQACPSAPPEHACTNARMHIRACVYHSLLRPPHLIPSSLCRIRGHRAHSVRACPRQACTRAPVEYTRISRARAHQSRTRVPTRACTYVYSSLLRPPHLIPSSLCRVRGHCAHHGHRAHLPPDECPLCPARRTAVGRRPHSGGRGCH